MTDEAAKMLADAINNLAKAIINETIHRENPRQPTTPECRQNWTASYVEAALRPYLNGLFY